MTTIPSPQRASATRDRIPALRAEVTATQAKLERLRASLATRQKALNRLLAENAMIGAFATARTGHE